MSLIDRIFPIETAEKWASAMEFPDSVMYDSAEIAYKVFAPVTDAFDNFLRSYNSELYDYCMSHLNTIKHPFAERLPFLCPSHVLLATLSYFLLIAVFRLLGVVLGKGSYKPLGLFHNYFLHVLSLYMSVGLAVSARAAGYSLWNNAAGTNEKDFRVAKLVWVFYVSKVPEWMDTVLMLLKHNYHQVSFLHVYHHVTIYVIWWLACWMAPGGEAYYSAMVNSGVHVVMYFYYFVTMLFPQGSVRHFLNHFKFVITKGQMTQFAFNCLQSVYDLLIVPRNELKYSANLLQLLFWYMISLLFLFGNFLVKGKKKHREGKRHGHGHSHANGAKENHSNGHASNKSNHHKNGTTPKVNGEVNGNGVHPGKAEEMKQSPVFGKKKN